MALGEGSMLMLVVDIAEYRLYYRSIHCLSFVWDVQLPYIRMHSFISVCSVIKGC